MKQIIIFSLLFGVTIYLIDYLRLIFGYFSLTVCLLFICWHSSKFIVEYIVNNEIVPSQGKAVLITELWAVINNAGIAHYSISEFGASGIKLYEDMINVNALGCVRVTKTFLPLLRKVRESRIVIVSSIAGAVDIPYLNAYCMSKFAVRSFANAIRRELKSFDVFVSIVEPSVYNTAIADETAMLKDFENTCNQTPQHIRDDYGNEQRKAADIVRALIRTKLRNIDDVVNALVDGVSKKTPRSLYRIGSVFTRTSIYLHTILALEVSDFLFTYYPSLIMHKMTAVIHRLLKL